MANKDKPITMRITSWEYEQLQKIARVENRTVNQVVNDALYEYAFQQYLEAKNFLDSVDNGMLNPTRDESKKYLKKLYASFSAKAEATRQMYEQRKLEDYLEDSEKAEEEGE